MEPTPPAPLAQAFSGANLSQVTCSTGLEPGINDHGGDAEVVEAGSDCGGPDHGGQDVRPGGFRSQGPRLFHQPPQLPHPLHQQQQYTSCGGTSSGLGAALAGTISLQEETQGPGLLARPPPCLLAPWLQLS